jgi:hypothetical protein
MVALTAPTQGLGGHCGSELLSWVRKELVHGQNSKSPMHGGGGWHLPLDMNAFGQMIGGLALGRGGGFQVDFSSLVVKK